MSKILQIGNYPPPMCGWAIQTKLVTEELRRRGHTCEVLKINENRRVKHPDYIDVQGGVDYLVKVLRYAWRGYLLNVHVNGMSKKGYLLALAAVLAGRLAGQPALITFHGGLSQAYFPRPDSYWLRFAFRWLFRLSGGIACDSPSIKRMIEDYGIPHEKVTAIATFSPQYLNFVSQPLSQQVESFLANHGPVFFSYVSFRPEYRLEVLRNAMMQFRRHSPRAGFVWLGFPDKEMPTAESFVRSWSEDERQSLLLLGNLSHGEFLTLLTRCFAYIRTPACDGVSASVLESLALGIPVVASENDRRPVGVITYSENDAAELCSRLCYLAENYQSVRAGMRPDEGGDNVASMADWLSGEAGISSRPEVAHVG